MPAITLSKNELLALNPCMNEPQHKRILTALRLKDRMSAADAVAAGATCGDLVWVAAKLDNADVDRRLRLFGADCAAQVLHIFEAYNPNDFRPRNAIIAARSFARGEIDAAALAAAAADALAAKDAARAARWAAAAAVWAAWVGGTDSWTAPDAAAANAAAAWAAAWAAWDTADAADAKAASTVAAIEQWQLDRLVTWMSDQEPEDWPLDAVVESGG